MFLNSVFLTVATLRLQTCNRGAFSAGTKSRFQEFVTRDLSCNRSVT